MKTVFILGENSFIAKHIYIKIKQNDTNQNGINQNDTNKNTKYNVILLNHINYLEIRNALNEDVIINCCGMNRSTSQIEYDEANHMFLHKVINCLNNKPFIIHISSLMVYGFENKELNMLSDYQKWFIESKLNGENHLLNNYDNTLLTIIRPSNIYGYDCKPYYNNLLSTLVYEKICGETKINNININCYRNMLSIHNLTDKIYEIIVNRTFGIYNILSTNNTSLKTIIDCIYDYNSPKSINLLEGDNDIPNISNSQILGSNIIIEEDLNNEIKQLEKNMRTYIELKNDISIKKISVLVQPRGNMSEISGLQSKRLYKITLNQHSVRGNHYHYTQIEEFYTNKDRVLYLFANINNKNVIYYYISNENELLTVKPNIIHTLANDFISNFPEIIISSTQEFVPNSTPDTEYVSII